MRALSVTPPWPFALLHCGKGIENRERWNGCSYRGPLAIHASGLPSGVASWWKHRDPERRQTESQWEAMMDFKCLLEDCRDIARDNGIEPPRTTVRELLESSGHIVGVVDLVGVVRPDGSLISRHKEPSATVLLRDQTRPLTEAEKRWHFGGFALVFENPRPLARPVPCKGALGLWAVPQHLARAVEAQLAA